MTRRLLVSYLTITAFVLVILEVPLAITYQRSEKAQLVATLTQQANTIGAVAEGELENRGDSNGYLERTLNLVRERSEMRAVVLRRDGYVYADTSQPAATSRAFLHAPEVVRALDLTRKDRVYAQTVNLTRVEHNIDVLVVVVPIQSGQTLYGGVRMSYPLDNFTSLVHRRWFALGLLALVVLSAVAVAGSLLARSVTQPVRALERAVGSLAAGDLEARAPTDEGPPEVRRLAIEFNDMARRLNQLIRAQRAFVADASHELRTPLTALRLRIENLAYADPSNIDDEIDELGSEIARLNRLVEGLLGMARADGQRPERETLDLTSELQQRVEAWQPLAEEQGVELSQYTPNTPLYVAAVKGGVAQILDNFLANALEVSKAGQRITIALDSDGSVATAHVIDQGPGLTPDARERAFDRFWRAPTARPGKGTGLGLAIVRQIAEASGGRAELREGPGGVGVDAVAVLPLASDAGRLYGARDARAGVR